MALQKRLRAPGGCPWDHEQTHESLRKFLLEETYEVLDAMEAESAEKFSSELGDLLLQVVFHSVLAEEAGRFTIADVIDAVYTKMVRRHPHVFGTAQANSSADVLRNWEEIKAQERSQERLEKSAGNRANAKSRTPETESILSGVPRSLPAVLEAYQLTRRAARVGFDWDSLEGILAKLEEEKRELGSAVADSRAGFGKSGDRSSARAKMEGEMGDLLFVAVNIARFIGVDPEIALKKANRKFKNRFTWMERKALDGNRRFADLPRDRMEQLWEESKRSPLPDFRN